MTMRTTAICQYTILKIKLYKLYFNHQHLSTKITIYLSIIKSFSRFAPLVN